MKKLFINLLVLLFATVTIAVSQTKGPLASFETEAYDFGKINESDGPVTFKFQFTNIGGSPLILSNVTASCGCTTPSWPKEPILPGAKSSIEVTYNPANRPGRFEKQITITSNADPATQILKIKGDVIPRTPTVEDQFPNNIEGLRLKSTQMNINSITPDGVSSQSMEVYNSTDAPLTVSFANVPKHIKAKIAPEVIQPKAKAIIEVTFDAKVKNDWGFVFDGFDVLLNGKTSPNGRLSVSANIQEDFTGLTEEQKQKAPKIEVDNATFDFGTVKQGEKVKYEYTYKNTGKSDLMIRKISPSCGCTAADSKNNIVKPGENGTISTEFNTTGRTGSQSKTITVITNDPANPRIILWIKGTVQ